MVWFIIGIMVATVITDIALLQDGRLHYGTAAVIIIGLAALTIERMVRDDV